MRALSTLLHVCLFGGTLVAQTSWFPDGEETSTTRPGVVPGEKGDGTEPPVAEGIAVGTTNECIVMATTRPSRIPPGGSGMLIITMALTGDAVITTDTPIVLLYTEMQGHLTLGGYVLRPAKHTMGPGPLLGQPVYDESVILEVPVSVTGDAVDGEYVAGLRVEFELKNGRSGFSKGRFATGISGRVRVGDPLPVFAAQGGVPVAGFVPSDLPDPKPRTARGAVPAAESAGLGGGIMGESSGQPTGVGRPVAGGPPGFSLKIPLAVWVFLGAGGLALLATLGMLLTRAVRYRRA